MSQRTEQVASVIKQRLGELISREVELPLDHLATITRVEVTPDLKEANVFISVLPFDSSEEILGLLNEQRGRLQKMLHEDMTMKFSPKLNLLQDTQPEQASEIERLIDEELSMFG